MGTAPQLLCNNKLKDGKPGVKQKSQVFDHYEGAIKGDEQGFPLLHTIPLRDNRVEFWLTWLRSGRKNRNSSSRFPALGQHVFLGEAIMDPPG